MIESPRSKNPFFRALHTAEDFSLGAILLVMVLFSFFQLVLKNLVTEFDLWGRHYTIIPFQWLIDNIGPGFSWGDAFLRKLVLWLAVLGASVATRQDRHINVEIASKFLPKNWAAGVRVFTDAFTSVICGFLSYTGVKLVQSEMGSGSLAFANVPAWVAELIIPVGFGMIALRFVRYFILHLLQVLHVVPIPADNANPPPGETA